MTAATATVTRSRTRTEPRALAGLGALLGFMVRRDRIRLPAWALGLGSFAVYVSVAIPAVYTTEEDLQAVTSMLADPMGRLLIGPGYGFDAPTYDRIITGGYGLYLLLLVALMSILTVVRHTRVEEQTGRAELVRASVVGRHTPLTAALIVTTLTNLATAVVVGAVLIGIGGFGVAGSLLMATSLLATGLAFAGVGAVAAQLSEYSRAASGLAGAVLGAAFVLRAGGDMATEGGNLLSWLSPLGWAQQSAPFVLDRWWPLLLLVALAAVTTVAGYALSTRRDLAASLFAARSGRPRAHPSLGTPLGLAARLQRTATIAWTIALAVSGLVFGAFTDVMSGTVDDLPEAFLELFGAEEALAGYLGYMAVFMGYFVAVYAILAVQGLANEEARGRAEPLLSTPLSRRSWLGTNVAVTAAGVVTILAATGAATGTGAWIVTGDASYLWDLTAAHLNQAPAVLVVLGLATLAFGLAPRAVPATWAVVAYALIAGTFGRLLDLPQVALGLSPFDHAAEIPLEAFAVVPVVVLTAISLALITGGLVAFRRRPITAGG
ncbi:MAG: ABC transporter permease [Acidimicrobiales bacterium]